MRRPTDLLPALPALLLLASQCAGKVLTPPYINIAQNAKVEASYTCGEGIEGTELYCKLIGANQDWAIFDNDVNIIQGYVCDSCDLSNPEKSHPPSNAVDGTESYWMSPPLSRGMEYSQVNFTIDLGQEFHVAYVIIKMGISPRPGTWVLEKSSDNGATFTPWQYFAGSDDECAQEFGEQSLQPITRDDSVVCDTSFSSTIVPVEDGEIVVSLLNDRPSAKDFFNSTVLQEWTRATHVRLRLLKVKTLFAHVMSFLRQDPTVTRRYYYSIRDISIGGRCRCNGHADTCVPVDGSFKRVCDCKHNTTGINCERCKDNLVQKKWRQSKSYAVFECEECNCHGHTHECVYNETVDALGLSLDKYGKYDGGGVCQNCQDNTMGINCERCVPGYYKPYGRKQTQRDACEKCRCDEPFHTGNCAEGTGICECKVNYEPPFCDRCAYGYFGFPTCKNCTCFINGTIGGICEPDKDESICRCKPNYTGDDCRSCQEGYFNFPECKKCDCHLLGSDSEICNITNGQCDCRDNFGGQKCDQCAHGFYDFPACTFCKCDPRGTVPEVCDKRTGQCICKDGFGGERCEKCIPGYKDYPECQPCGCSKNGSNSEVCDVTGKCNCRENFSGKTCSQCAFGYYKYPECLRCNCETFGTVKNAQSCDDTAQCQCREGIEGKKCDRCKEGLYNFPTCEECNCDPAGVTNSTDCGELSKLGQLCECKPRVMGRTCKECRPLYWNLQHYNPHGCEECACNSSGVVGGIAVCDSKSGQCFCKQNTASRQCDTCVDGTYKLEETNIFGCTDCSCDVGGALDRHCNKETGECACRPRITGRTCNQPLRQHYFPTLHQFKYELEDGTTPDNRLLSYGYEESVFPGFSWRGYAIFTHVQNTVRKDVRFLVSNTLHYILMRYVNRNDEVVHGLIQVRHEEEEPIERKIHFKPTLQPAYAFATSIGNIPDPIVATSDGKWDVDIIVNQSLFIDYMVLIPQSYFEGNILIDSPRVPCQRGGSSICKQYIYPSIDSFDIAYGDSAFVLKNGAREDITDFLEDWEKPMGGSKLAQLPELSPASNEIRFELRVRNRNPTFMVIDYVTPSASNASARITVDIEGDMENYSTNIKLPPCPYTWVCRQALLDQTGKLASFNINEDFVTVIVTLENEGSVGVESVSLIPYDASSAHHYLQPALVCLSRDGICRPSTYETPLSVKKVEFEAGNNEGRKVRLLPQLVDNTTSLVYLDKEDTMIDLTGKVPSPGNYTFIVHYYQPNHPAYNLDAIIHNGDTYEGVLPLVHCPSTSGCRSVLKIGKGNSTFLEDNFFLTLKLPGDQSSKNVWLDYVLVIPESKYSTNLINDKLEGDTAKFLEECTNNYFSPDNNISDFCKSAIFSLTTFYNDGALKCECHPDGSYSLQCEQFGGQCKCKENIIGRRCERCKTGFYNFPECFPCDCHENSLCDEETGQCSCPPNVIGEYCDQCANNTYGYFPQLGCRECECNAFGLQDGNLQCDPAYGTCNCRDNVVGRQCDSCAAGYYDFPVCSRCDCDPKGTTYEICDTVGNCLCKENVEGDGCDICREGSFNIQPSNRLGCTKCFCFEHSYTCKSSPLYKSLIHSMDKWKIASITVKKPSIDINVLEDNEPIFEEPDSLGIDFYDEELKNKIIYFSAPVAYLGNRLTSYGGFINYTLLTTAGPTYDPLESTPDLVLVGANLNLLYFSNELPSASDATPFSTEITEGNFVLSNNFLPASRSQFMQVLQNLQALYIKGTYWKNSKTTRINGIFLDSASTENTNRGQALSVEQCDCEPQYTGLSCEECAPGYYRSNVGPYGGNCVPCQCHGHAATCDKETGICIDCQHNTTGDHCEKCAVGYHGDARNGSPYDCLICACPLPVPSNNFALSCELSSPDGFYISCNCKEGYFGSKCESCAVGYYGDPTKEGEGECKPCDCSGNIDPNVTGSCDSRTGECLQCLYNTYGEACALCKPFYFGDAVYAKNCQSCLCDKCGSDRCNDKTGDCECKPNVTGERCDQCLPDHYGLKYCQGCKPCECGIASESTQCDLDTGNCKCKPGVTGRACDRCDHGYWNYTSEGCTLCSCNTGYSVGVGCSPTTGECECLPGVIGEKCDHCPHRWVLKPAEGCLACDKCIDDLLDTMDAMHNKFGPFAEDFKSFNESFFTRQRLNFTNQSVNDLRPNVTQIDNVETEFVPLKDNVNSIADEVDKLARKLEYLTGKTNDSMDQQLSADAKKTNDLVDSAINKAKASVAEVISIAESFKNGAGAKHSGYSGFEYDLQEAKEILKELNALQLQHKEDEIRRNSLSRAEGLLESIKKVKDPVDSQNAAIANISERIRVIEDKFKDLLENAKTSRDKSQKLLEQTTKLRQQSLPEKFKTISTLEGVCQDTLKEANENINDTIYLLNNVSSNLKQLKNDISTWEELQEEAAQKTGIIKDNEDEIIELVLRAKDKGAELQRQGEELKKLQSEFEHDSNAVQAYKNIVHTLRDALIAADEAKRTAENASDTSQGIGDRAFEARNSSTSLLNTARDTLRQSQEELEPALYNANKILETLEVQKEDMEAELEAFEEALKKADGSLGLPDSDGKAVAEEAAVGAGEIQDRIRDLVDDLPQKIVTAKQISDNTKDAAAAIDEADSTITNVMSVLPNITELANKLVQRPPHDENQSLNVKSMLDNLRSSINRAREIANTIKVGVSTFPNTTLQLRNPPNLPEQGINNKVSVYFNTSEANGLLFFLGNEAHENQIKRSVKTGDFIALEVENGNLKLTVDLGSGSTSISCDKYVSDGTWHFAQVERTGKNMKLTVTRLKDNGICEKEGLIKGNTAVLNLDKKHSKFFAGGLPTNFDAPPVLSYNTFVGELEELLVDGQLVSFWNLQEAENLYPARERDVKSGVSPTGFRFSGDESFVVLNTTGWQLNRQSEIVLQFKTYAKEGLMFFAPSSNSKFLSIELREGRVLFQYDLGSGPLTLVSSKSYNDGEWHSIEATRFENKGNLKVDGVTIEKGESSSDSISFETPEVVFFGGFPGEHNNGDVVETDFDGCIDNVQIAGNSVDLDENIESAGVIPGCPPKFAGMVSFEPGARGYALYPNASAHHNTMELILRFKTSAPDGLLAYADYVHASASLALDGGQIVFRVGDQDLVRSDSSKPYNDSEWHVVMANYDPDSLQIYIDDHETYKSQDPPTPIRMLHGNLYFGGVPSKVNAAAAISRHFSGCISDATLNGIIINFGNLTEAPDTIIGKCAEGGKKQPIHRPPALPPPKIPVTEPPSTTTTTISPNVIPLTETPGEPSLVERPDHHPQCKLPLYPALPVQEVEFSAYRIGTAAGSRVEFQATKIKHKFDFSVDIKTGASEGLIFYASDERHVDFVAIYISEGKVNYRFNCGSGEAHITSAIPVNDKKWHTISWQRQGNFGTLSVDGQNSEGSSSGNAKTLNVETPFFVGGIDPTPLIYSPELLQQVLYNVKGINNSLDGCIKNFKINNQPSGKPSNKVKVTPCDTEYRTIYFSPDGGYIKLAEKFRIGKRLEVMLEVRPRALSGLLLSVHSKEAYMILELVNGEVRMAVDVGSGEISAVFKLSDPHVMCDGNWHMITVLKSLNVLTLAVDGQYSDPFVGSSKRKDLDTKHTLYLGGHPSIRNLKGSQSKDYFIGCIRNLSIRAQAATIEPRNIVGNVTGGVCPD